MQWLNCKRRTGERYPLHFRLFLFLPVFPPLPGSCIIYPSGVRIEAPAAYAFWCILSLIIAPGGNIFLQTFYEKKTAVYA